MYFYLSYKDEPTRTQISYRTGHEDLRSDIHTDNTLSLG